MQSPMTAGNELEDEESGRLLQFILVAAVVGALTGLVAASFKVALHWAAEVRLGLTRWSHHQLLGLLLFVACTSLTSAAAAALVRRVEPHAEGSGIPRVEAVVAGRTPFGRRRILPVKFVGGVLAIGAGLALGREGPLVQMGGNVGISVARMFRRRPYDMRLLVAGGAAAGLATAFNAPIAGAVFVLEELLKRFHPRTTLATLAASGSGFLTARLIAPDAPDLHVAPLLAPRAVEVPWVVLAGAVCGLLGVAYNHLVMGCLHVADGLTIPAELRAAAVGALVGVVGWFGPSLVAGGDGLTDRALQAHYAVATLLGVLVLRFFLGAVSYAAGTPGGLFAPQLVLGSHAGLLVGLLGVWLAPSWAPQPAALALVGMAAFFTATVRAPVTGIILATEMTASTTALVPMLGACAVAMLVAQAMGCQPIYDALTDRSVAINRRNQAERGGSTAAV